MNKICTTIEQSQKLIELGIDIGTTDMCWQNNEFPIGFNDNDDAVPAWSLAALLNVLPKGTDIVKEEADTENERYMCTVGIKDDIISTFGNNPVDACYEMILKLNELKML